MYLFKTMDLFEIVFMLAFLLGCLRFSRFNYFQKEN